MSEKRKNEKGRQKNKAEKEENNEKKNPTDWKKGYRFNYRKKSLTWKKWEKEETIKKREDIRKMKRLYERG